MSNDPNANRFFGLTALALEPQILPDQLESTCVDFSILEEFQEKGTEQNRNVFRVAVLVTPPGLLPKVLSCFNILSMIT